MRQAAPLLSAYLALTAIAAPAYAEQTTADLVKAADRIVVAKCLRAKEDTEVIAAIGEFQTVELVKGNLPQAFTARLTDDQPIDLGEEVILFLGPNDEQGNATPLPGEWVYRTLQLADAGPYVVTTNVTGMKVFRAGTLTELAPPDPVDGRQVLVQPIPSVDDLVHSIRQFLKQPQ